MVQNWWLWTRNHRPFTDHPRVKPVLIQPGSHLFFPAVTSPMSHSFASEDFLTWLPARPRQFKLAQDSSQRQKQHKEDRHRLDLRAQSPPLRAPQQAPSWHLQGRREEWVHSLCSCSWSTPPLKCSRLFQQEVPVPREGLWQALQRGAGQCEGHGDQRSQEWQGKQFKCCYISKVFLHQKLVITALQNPLMAAKEESPSHPLILPPSPARTCPLW